MNRRALALSIVVLVAGCGQSTHTARDQTSPSAGGPTSSTVGPTPTLSVSHTALDAIADQYRSACKSPGAAVGVRLRDGATAFAVSGRFAPDLALGRESQFLAGSVTKLFVATVAYQLIAAHEITPNDTVDRYLPDWPRGHEITVAMLLGHRSGMGDFGNDFNQQLTDLVLADLRRDFRYSEVLDLVRAVPPVAAPGTTYHYSNANYIVLGAILQRVTHKTLGELLDARIIEPLHLAHTLYGPDDLAAARKIVFHGLFDVLGNGMPVDIGGFPRTAALTVDPAGAGLFSSLPDLLTFTHALFATNSLLAAAERTALGNAVSTLTAKDLVLDRRFVIHGHGGTAPGAQTLVAYDGAHDTTVAVWCNRLDPGAEDLLPSVIAAKELFELASSPEP
jgi:D-alanyl-D-alanine carboxypeptidase